jgi:hypothetical protein
VRVNVKRAEKVETHVDRQPLKPLGTAEAAAAVAGPAKFLCIGDLSPPFWRWQRGSVDLVSPW